MYIVDGNVTLRAIEKEDNRILKQLINDPDTESKTGGWSFPVSEEKQELWFEAVTSSTSKTSVRFAVEVDGRCIGMAGFHGIDYKNSNAGVDIKLARESRGKGIGCKVVRMLQKYAFEELNLHILISEVLEDNGASRKTFEKAGFSLDGVIRDRVYKGGSYHGQCFYSVLKDEYMRGRGNERDWQ